MVSVSNSRLTIMQKQLIIRYFAECQKVTDSTRYALRDNVNMRLEDVQVNDVVTLLNKPIGNNPQ